MPFIRKEVAGNAPGGHEWPVDGHILEVTDERLVTDLLRIPGFSEVIPKGDTFSEVDDPGFVVNPQPPKRRPGRPRKNVTPHTPIVESAAPHHQIDSPIGHDVSGAPHAAYPVDWVKDDVKGKSNASQPGSDGREPGMVAPNAEALEANGARQAAWHARAVDTNI